MLEHVMLQAITCGITLTQFHKPNSQQDGITYGETGRSGVHRH